MRKVFFLLVMVSAVARVYADNGYKLWMRYALIGEETKRNIYAQAISSIKIDTTSPTLQAAARELVLGTSEMLGKSISIVASPLGDASIIAGTINSSFLQSSHTSKLLGMGKEAYLIQTNSIGGKNTIIIAGNTDIGVLYGCFHFLRLLQTLQDITNLAIVEKPMLQLRVLNHWDNLDRTVERGYAGFSIWKWHLLPGYKDPRYTDYARANASIGINGTVLSNVNANAQLLTDAYLQKAAALADVLRPYGIKVYLTARFSAPIEIGNLKTADPLDPSVIKWWKDKAAEIYKLIPDFGGFLVKANSEGQPGPQNFGRNHAEGANMLADALAPYKGIVMWRAFVYSNDKPEDRFKQAYNEFKPLDGLFRSNVLLQVKNGPIDFQPREPFSPLFGSMEKTPLMMEFQLTQEYLGQGTHLAYLAPLFREVLDADTYLKGKGSPVAKVLQDTSEQKHLTGMAGVSNIGDDFNWTGHPFAQANWYYFGRLAWKPEADPKALAREWLQMTFTSNDKFLNPVSEMMLRSRASLVDYMTPLGLHHIMGWSHHYGPAPWISDKPRADWTSVYYHKANKDSIGFDRTATGSNALAQYKKEVSSQFTNLKTCPEEFLLWFHRVPWKYKLKNGETLWEGLCRRYEKGVMEVEEMQQTWTLMHPYIDHERFEHVSMLLAIQKKEAWWWHDACLAYFHSLNQIPYPREITKPKQPLNYYQSQEHFFVPGN